MLKVKSCKNAPVRYFKDTEKFKFKNFLSLNYDVTPFQPNS